MGNSYTFTTAYLDPAIPAHVTETNMDLASRADMVIVSSPQTAGNEALRKRIKYNALNKYGKNIIMLGYMLMAERTLQNQPGKARMIAIPSGPDYECNYLVSGSTFYPTLNGFRLFDYRSDLYARAFADATADTLASSTFFDGVFWDNCTVFNTMHTDPVVRAQMRVSLHAALSLARSEHPSVIFCGNGAETWIDINGELNEGRPSAYATELTPHTGQSSPRMDLAQLIGPMTETQILAARNGAIAYGPGVYTGYAPVASNYQTMAWPQTFEDARIAVLPPPATPPTPIRLRFS